MAHHEEGQCHGGGMALLNTESALSLPPSLQAHMDPADPLAATALAKLGSLALRRGAVKDAEALLVKAIRIWATTPLVYEATDLAAAQSLLAEVGAPCPYWHPPSPALPPHPLVISCAHFP